MEYYTEKENNSILVANFTLILFLGAWLQDGKGENVWDRFTHTNPSAILDGSNADESADSYNHIEEDVEILNNLTVRHYKFSLSWSRLIPQGNV